MDTMSLRLAVEESRHADTLPQQLGRLRRAVLEAADLFDRIPEPWPEGSEPWVSHPVGSTSGSLPEITATPCPRCEANAELHRRCPEHQPEEIAIASGQDTEVEHCHAVIEELVEEKELFRKELNQDRETEAILHDIEQDKIRRLTADLQEARVALRKVQKLCAILTERVDAYMREVEEQAPPKGFRWRAAVRGELKCLLKWCEESAAVAKAREAKSEGAPDGALSPATAAQGDGDPAAPLPSITSPCPGDDRPAWRQEAGELLAAMTPGTNAGRIAQVLNAHLAEDAAREARHRKLREEAWVVLKKFDKCNLRPWHIKALRAALEEDEDV